MSNFVSNKTSNSENKSDLPSQLQWLKFEAPGFSVHGSQIKILLTPDEFYHAIIQGCQEANHKIALAAFYIGKGELEEKMVEVLDERMTERGRNLKVSILLDAVRGERDESAGTLLLPLVQKHPTCKVCLFHNPDLRGMLLRLLPVLANESIGVQHIKLYVFDDNVLISGANLNKDYFTVRQDRYMLISNCQPLAEFCIGLIDKLSLMSLRLLEDKRLVAQTPECHPYLSPREDFVKYALKVVWDHYKLALKKSDKKLRPGDDTWIFPMLQLPPLGILQDSSVTQKLLECSGKNTTVHMTIPYFNLPEEYVTSFLQKCQATFSILIPHPTANNFHGAKGMAGEIPRLYTILAKNFLHRVEESDQAGRVSVQEFSCPKGSFHCKGFWITEPGDTGPYLTVIGSSNFNYRSVKRDLECQMIVVTNNEDLRRRFREEYELLFSRAIPFNLEVLLQPDRRATLVELLFLWFFKNFL